MPQVSLFLYIFGSVFIVSLISVLGIFALSVKTEVINKVLVYLVSFSAGALFGDVFFHLFPEVTAEHGFTLSVSISVLAGIVLMFMVEKFVHWRHCHHTNHDGDHQKIHPFAIMNLIGDAFHNILDGLIIAASYLVSLPVGIATTIAVILHEVPQEIGDFGVLIHGGFSKKQAVVFNFLTALTAFLGACIAIVMAAYVDGITTYLVPLSAGAFIYIAGSYLIPELHKETEFEKTLLQFFAFIGGMVVMSLLLFLG